MKPFCFFCLIIVAGVALLAGCATESDFSDKSFKERYANGSKFHPKGARLTKPEAIQLGAEAFEKMGFRSADLGNPRALYLGPMRGMFGVTHKDWDVHFLNKSASASRWPALSVYVDDRTGRTDAVEKDAHP